ncbi:MAG: TonB-dependent receptor [Myxococcales bacterium FL481]|nr:MAG: TonB-dependent receptor [Myxococcales bacterium FL481]
MAPVPASILAAVLWTASPVSDASRPDTVPESPPETAPVDVVGPLERTEAAPAGPRGSEVSAGVVRGVVMRDGSGDSVAAVKIVASDGRVVESATDGSFRLTLSPGTHELLLRADGFEDRRQTITVQAGEDLVVTWRMRLDLDSDRFRTVVESDREVGVSRTELRDEEIHEVPGTRGDPFRVIQSLPGASQVAGFLPYVVVRGAAPGNTGYYLDGVRVPILFHVAVGPSVIHPYFIDEVHFYPGGTPVRLGRFASGIVEGRTKPPRRDRVSGELDLRITDAGMLLDIPIHRPVLPGCESERRRDCPRGPAKGALTFGGRFSYTGWLLSQFKELNIKLQFWDYQARLDHDLGRRFRYTAFAYGSFDSMGPREEIIQVPPSSEEPSSVDGPDDEEWSDDVWGTEVDTDPDPYLRFEFHRIDQRVRQRLRNGGRGLYMVALGFDRSGASTIKTNEWLVAPRLGFVWPLRPGVEIGMGLDQEFKVFKVDADLDDVGADQVEDLALLLSSRFVSATGLWSDLRWRKGLVELRPGVRVDLFAQVGASPYLPQARNITYAAGVDPRLLAREQIGDRVTLRQAVGVYHQPPDVAVPVPGIESLGFDRGLQRNMQASAGYELDILGGQARLTQDLYLGRLSNLQDFELATNSEDPPNELEDVLTDVAGWTYGVETMLKLSPKMRMFGWLAYTLSRATRRFPVGGSVASTWDQTHILNAVLGYKLAHHYRIGGRLHFNTGRPFTAAVGEQTYLEALAANRNNRRLPGFFQFDLRAERIFSFAKWQLHLFLDVTNATMTRETLFCVAAEADAGLEPGTDAQPAPGGVDGCPTPASLRYIIPAVGMRGVF